MTKTLFGRTTLIISSTMLAFSLAAATIVGYFIFVPMGKKYTEDLSALILLSAQTYVELPLEARQDFVDELSLTHELFWGSGDEPLVNKKHLKPPVKLIKKILSGRLQSEVGIASQVGNHHRYWVDITIAKQAIRIGFDQGRLGISLPNAALYLLTILAITAVLSSLLLVRKITKPIQSLSAAAKTVGSGTMPPPLAEKGPKELLETIKAFNKMSTDVQSLLENRTVLLGGISHDLRTPLTRMKMALEMLPDSVDSELSNELIESVDNMELIIQEYMQLTKGLEDENIERININTLITNIVKEIKPAKAQIVNIVGDTDYQFETYAVALHRVLFNLIENAISYGNKNPVSISWKQQDNGAVITITDQGSGIPEQHQEKIFRPFYRLESSRNRASGGTGLGLAIVDQIVTKRGWQIKLSSETNKGTQITLIL